MKRRQFIKAGLLWLPAIGMARAAGPFIISGPVGKSGVIASGQTFLLNENFEGTGLPTGWTDSSTGGTRDFDYTTTALEGSQSFYYNDPGAAGNVIVKAPFAASDQVYITFRIQCVTSLPTDGTLLLYVNNSSHTNLAEFRGLTTSSAVNIKSEGGTTSSAKTSILSTSASSKIKIRCKKGTGSNFESELWAVASGAGSWSTSVTSLNGTATTQPAELQFTWFHLSTSAGIIVDLIKVSTTDIAIGDA